MAKKQMLVDTVMDVKIYFDPRSKKFYANLPSGARVSRTAFQPVASYIHKMLNAGRADDFKGITIVYWSSKQNEYVVGTLTGRTEHRPLYYAEVHNKKDGVKMLRIHGEEYLGDQSLADQINKSSDLIGDMQSKVDYLFDKHAHWCSKLPKLSSKFNI